MSYKDNVHDCNQLQGLNESWPRNFSEFLLTMYKCIRNPEANIWAQDGENEEWRRIHNEELYSLNRSPKYNQGD